MAALLVERTDVGREEWREEAVKERNEPLERERERISSYGEGGSVWKKTCVGI